MYEAIIFDMDGTLIRTPVYYIIKTLESTLRKLGREIKIKKDTATEFWYKDGRSRYIKNKFRIKDVELFWKEFIETDSPNKRKEAISIYDDVSCLWSFKEKYKLKYGVLTNAHPEITEVELDFLGRDLVDIVVNSHPHNGIKPKPDPEGANYILDKLGVSNKKAIFVGDSESDILCARNVPMKEILIDRYEHEVRINAEKLDNLNDMRWFLEYDY